jgi:toxin secretion/phage lysis holin
MPHLDPIHYDVDMWEVLIPLAFMVLDIVTGIVKAVAKKELNSSKMRDGLFHKGGFIIALVAAILCEAAMQHMDLGFDVPLLTTASTYVVLTELTSILENVSVINPELGGSKLMSIFHSSKSDADQKTEA